VLNGHYQYFGVIFNYRSLRLFKDCVVRYWRKALSQKGRMNWTTYRQLLTAFPLPEPAIHQTWLQ
jgi:RNA-directed DNA polymerase